MTSNVVPGTVVPGFCDPGSWSAAFGMSYRDLVLADGTVGKRLIVREGGSELRVRASSGGIADARNSIARDFLDSTDGEWLWMVDTDMGFEADCVYRLLDSADPDSRPVVGALCFALHRDGPSFGGGVRYTIVPTLYDYVQTADEVGFRAVPGYPPDAVVPVAATGAACLLIHRSALERVRGKHPEAWFTPITHITGDHGKPRTFSEDLSFCVRLAGLGIVPHVDTGVKTTHDKGGIFLDEEAFARQQATVGHLAGAAQVSEPSGV